MPKFIAGMIFGWLTVWAWAYAQEPPLVNLSPWSGPTSLVISRDSVKPMVTISMKDGSIIFGEDYTPDAASRAFWEAISEEYRKMLKWKAEHPDER